MSVTIVPKSEQASGEFNGGAILENKPIGFPQDGGSIKPYSNLFYWAHAWTDEGSTIGEHPHKGFEIMSFVLKGDIEHYDSKNKDWRKLNTGDAQIIRSGNGISHAERMNPGAQIFQIWVDPNMNKSLEKPATYDDYPSDSFPVSETGGVKIKTYKGDEGPMQMDTEGIRIYENTYPAGTTKMILKTDKVYSAFLLDGPANLDGNELETGDYVIIKEEDKVELKIEGEARFFIIESPLRPTYATYSELFQKS